MVASVGSANRQEQQTYWQQLQLKADPFAGGDRDDYFPVLQWQEHFEFFEHSIFYSNALLMLSGEINSGKTTVAQQFQEYCADRLSVSLINAHSRLDADELIDIIAATFNVPVNQSGYDDVEQACTDILEQLTRRETHSVLMIDNAHRLSENFLEFLLQLANSQSSEQNGLHFILFGESELQKHLTKCTQRQGYEDLLLEVTLEPFTLDATTRYLKHCLNQAGAEEKNGFSKAEMERIYKLSEGYIGRINQVAKQLLISSITGTSTQRFSWQSKQLRIVGASTLAVIAIVYALLLHDNGDDVVAVTSNPAPLAKQSAPPFVAQAVKPNRLFADQSRTPRKLLKLAQQKKSITVFKKDKDIKALHSMPSQLHKNIQTSMAVPQQQKTKLSHVTAIPQTKAGHISKHFVQHPFIKKTTMPPARTTQLHHVIKPQRIEKQHTIVNKQLAVNKQQQISVPKALIDEVIVIPDVKSIKPKIAVRKKQKKHAQIKKIKPVLSIKHVNKKSKKRILTTDESKLLATNPRYFSIQLLGTSNRDALKLFVDTHKLQKNAKSFRVKRDGKQWYVLVYGKYTSLKQASAAAKKLSNKLKQLKPWVRSYSSIQQLIKQS